MADAIVSAVLQSMPIENLATISQNNSPIQFQSPPPQENAGVSGNNNQRDTLPTSSAIAESNILLSTNQQQEECAEPVKKKLKLENDPKSNNKLEERLNGVFCCAVCLDLPSRAVFQCTHGHLMCAGCLNHLLADARLKDETATCPTCRTEIGKVSCCRNLAVEKAISQLPSSCKFCSQELPRSTLPVHEKDQCDERLSGCKYECVGCPWKGPYHERQGHEQRCQIPTRPASQVLPYLEERLKSMEDDARSQARIFDLLSLEHMSFHELQLKPYRTDEYIHKLFYETGRFSAFSGQWVVKARVNDNQRDPSLSVERTLSYQLVMKSKQTPAAQASQGFSLSFLLLKGPYGDMSVEPRIYSHDFTSDSLESPYCRLHMDSVECNKLLASAAISVRLLIFQSPK